LTDPKASVQPTQIEGIKFLTTHHRVLLADKMGLGKTLTALASAYLRGSLLKRTFIPCTKSALSIWRKEVKLWFPELFDRLVIVEGNKKKRAELWKKVKSQECIYVCTYKVLLEDQDIIPRNWDLIMPDEAHKVARNRKTLVFNLLTEFQSTDMYIITGTPVSKGVEHMYGYLFLLYPDRFPSYWQFLNHFCIIEDGPYGKENMGNKNMDELKEILSTIMIRRLKSGDMPAKHRIKFYVEMSDDERRVYEQIDTTGILGRADGSFLLSAIQATNQLRCRQLFVCPKLLDPTLDVGSSLRAVTEFIEDQEVKHTVIFCPFPAAFPFFKEFIQSELKHTVFELRGGMDSVKVQKVIDSWKCADKGIILCSTQFATSFNLTKASYGFMIGFEWDQDHNYQAEDRLHRLGITEDVMIYYVIHDNVLMKRQLEIMSGNVDRSREVLGDAPT